MMANPNEADRTLVDRPSSKLPGSTSGHAGGGSKENKKRKTPSTVHKEAPPAASTSAKEKKSAGGAPRISSFGDASSAVDAVAAQAAPVTANAAPGENCLSRSGSKIKDSGGGVGGEHKLKKKKSRMSATATTAAAAARGTSAAQSSALVETDTHSLAEATRHEERDSGAGGEPIAASVAPSTSQKRRATSSKKSATQPSTPQDSAAAVAAPPSPGSAGDDGGGSAGGSKRKQITTTTTKQKSSGGDRGKQPEVGRDKNPRAAALKSAARISGGEVPANDGSVAAADGDDIATKKRAAKRPTRSATTTAAADANGGATTAPLAPLPTEGDVPNSPLIAAAAAATEDIQIAVEDGDGLSLLAGGTDRGTAGGTDENPYQITIDALVPPSCPGGSRKQSEAILSVGVTGFGGPQAVPGLSATPHLPYQPHTSPFRLVSPAPSRMTSQPGVVPHFDGGSMRANDPLQGGSLGMQQTTAAAWMPDGSPPGELPAVVGGATPGVVGGYVIGPVVGVTTAEGADSRAATVAGSMSGRGGRHCAVGGGGGANFGGGASIFGGEGGGAAGVAGVATVGGGTAVTGGNFYEYTDVAIPVPQPHLVVERRNDALGRVLRVTQSDLPFVGPNLLETEVKVYDILPGGGGGGSRSGTDGEGGHHHQREAAAAAAVPIFAVKLPHRGLWGRQTVVHKILLVACLIADVKSPLEIPIESVRLFEQIDNPTNMHVYLEKLMNFVSIQFLFPAARLFWWRAVGRGCIIIANIDTGKVQAVINPEVSIPSAAQTLIRALAFLRHPPDSFLSRDVSYPTLTSMRRLTRMQQNRPRHTDDGFSEIADPNSPASGDGDLVPCDDEQILISPERMEELIRRWALDDGASQWMTRLIVRIEDNRRKICNFRYSVNVDPQDPSVIAVQVHRNEPLSRQLKAFPVCMHQIIPRSNSLLDVKVAYCQALFFVRKLFEFHLRIEGKHAGPSSTSSLGHQHHRNSRGATVTASGRRHAAAAAPVAVSRWNARPPTRQHISHPPSAAGGEGRSRMAMRDDWRRAAGLMM